MPRCGAQIPSVNPPRHFWRSGPLFDPTLKYKSDALKGSGLTYLYSHRRRYGEHSPLNCLP
jgi:hypothetical protein